MMMTRQSFGSLFVALCMLLPANTAAASKDGVEYYRSDAAAKLDLPFSEAVIVGDLLFLSGQLGNRPGTPELIAGGIAAEARQTMDIIGAVLEANPSTRSSNAP